MPARPFVADDVRVSNLDCPESYRVSEHRALRISWVSMDSNRRECSRPCRNNRALTKSKPGSGSA
eukprot:3941582-Rhodomonas_salina.4